MTKEFDIMFDGGAPQGSAVRRRLDAVQTGISGDKSEGTREGLAFIGGVVAVGIVAAIVGAVVKKSMRVAALRRAAGAKAAAEAAAAKATAQAAKPPLFTLASGEDVLSRNIEAWATAETARAAAFAQAPMIERVRVGSIAYALVEGRAYPTIVDAVDRRGLVLSTDLSKAVAAESATFAAFEGVSAVSVDVVSLVVDASTGTWRAAATGPGLRVGAGIGLPCDLQVSVFELGAQAEPLKVTALGCAGFAAVDAGERAVGDSFEISVDLDDGAPAATLSCEVVQRDETNGARRIAASFRSAPPEVAARIAAFLLRRVSESAAAPT